MAQTVEDEQAAHTWTYAMVRPLETVQHYVRRMRVKSDCSKGVQFLCRWAGAPDPMKNNYGPYGNSQTLCIKLQHLANPSELEIGDIVTFGSYGQDHAAMVYERGVDPLLWSDGHQGAPNFYRLSADRRPHQLLRNPLPKHVPTEADKLRAKTGWFSWVAWKLGEGDWADYKPADPKVRPNVPKVISPAWWARYAEFLRNRNKANKANHPA